ncbi:cytochrome P450 family protein [Streptomyces broussonetiae]|uniref:Cytochrome P450 n=1 Tax=Streptomyces broussonetiae TaxID=2686304 RepID=A0ABV5ECX0_9ACTN
MSSDTATAVNLVELLFGPDRDAAFARLLDGPAIRPATYFDGSQVWLVTRYHDILGVLSDKRFSNDITKQSKSNLTASIGLPEDVAPYFLHTLGTYDPPDHTRLRRLLSREFTPRRVTQLRPRIQEITDELLDSLATEPEADLIDRFAKPLPVSVICELLGIPADDRSRWLAWSEALISGDLEKIADGARNLVAYLKDLLEEKRKAPGEDVLSGLMQAHEDGDRLSTEELVSLSLSLLIGGHDNTVNLIANGTLMLLTHPGQLARLRAEPDTMPTAVEELFRFAGPADIGVLRYALEPVEIGGVTIPAGDAVQVVYATGNRDPRRFEDPDRLDLARVDKAHLGLGHGIHHCIGAALARAEGEIALSRLITRFPDLELAAGPAGFTWKPATSRALAALPVRPGTPA